MSNKLEFTDQEVGVVLEALNESYNNATEVLKFAEEGTIRHSLALNKQKKTLELIEKFEELG